MVLGILLGYQLLLIGIGLWAKKRSETHEDFLIGGRRMGALVASLSYAAGASSAWTILGVSGIAFSQGVSAIWLLPGTISGHIVAWFFIAPRLRRIAHERKFVTVTDFLVDGLRDRTKQLAVAVSGIAIVFCFSFYIAAQFAGAGTALAASVDVNTETAIVVGAVIILAYTCLGGFWAVSLTDAMQAIVMLVACLILPIAILIELGGLMAIFDALDTSHLSLTGTNTGWLAVGFFVGMVSIGFGPLGQPHMLNRMMALSDSQALERARLIALAWFVLVLGGMFLSGLAGHALLTSAVESESVFFELSHQLLPSLVSTVLVVAVLSAVMSTADSQLLVAAGVASHDLKRSNSRVFVVLVGVVALVLALFVPESIFSRVLFAWNALGATFGPLVIHKLLRRPVHPLAVPIAMAAGFLLTVLFYSLQDTVGDVAERLIPFVVGWLILQFKPASSDIQNSRS